MGISAADDALANSGGDLIGGALQRGEDNIRSLCERFAPEATGETCSAKQIIGGIINSRQAVWERTQGEICREIDKGVSPESALQAAGLEEGTKLNCKIPSGPGGN